MKEGQQMSPAQFIQWTHDELKKGRSIVLPEKIIKDTFQALVEWEGVNKDDLIVHQSESFSNHVTLTLKKYVK